MVYLSCIFVAFTLVFQVSSSEYVSGFGFYRLFNDTMSCTLKRRFVLMYDILKRDNEL